MDYFQNAQGIVRHIKSIIQAIVELGNVVHVILVAVQETHLDVVQAVIIVLFLGADCIPGEALVQEIVRHMDIIRKLVLHGCVVHVILVVYQRARQTAQDIVQHIVNTKQTMVVHGYVVHVMFLDAAMRYKVTENVQDIVQHIASIILITVEPGNVVHVIHVVVY